MKNQLIKTFKALIPAFTGMAFLILVSGSFVSAACNEDGKRPPDTLENCEGEIEGFGQGIEIPAHIVATAGGVGDSITPPPGQDPHLDPHIMSWTLGEPMSGTFADNEACLTDRTIRCDIKLEVGYGFFEFYSDRIPLSSLSLTVNGGNVYTNTRDVVLEIEFSDDLSGFLSVELTESLSQEVRNISTLGSTNLAWRLGGFNEPDENVPDGDYSFDFEFHDRAGNISTDRPSRSIRYDTVPPSTGSIVINMTEGEGAMFTSSSVVAITLSSHDVGIATSGVSYVRVSNSSETPRNQWMLFPFIEPIMTIERWALAPGELGERAVFAQFRDAAGNWATGIASDTITFGSFSPEGTLVADVTNEDVNVFGDGYETSLFSVPLLIGWDDSFTGVLSRVLLSGGLEELSLNIGPDEQPPRPVSYGIADMETPDHLPGEYTTISAIFYDLASNPSPEVFLKVRFNQNRPPPPDVTVQTFVSSLTIRAEYLSPVTDIQSYTFKNISQKVGQSSGVIHVEYSTQPVTFVDDGLQPNTRYIYEVTSNDGLQDSLSGFSLDEEFYTLARPPAPGNPIKGLEIFALGIFWDTNGNPPGTLYRVQWSLDPTFSSFESIGDSGWINYTSNTEYQALDLETGKEYFVRVKARNNRPIETKWVSLGSGFTESFRSPLPPSNLRADQQSISSTTITWLWDRTPSTEEGFILLDPINENQEIARIFLTESTPSLKFVERGLAPNSEIVREVVAFNHFEGRETRTDGARSPVVYTLPATPKPLPLIVSGSEITAHWDANENDEETEYEVVIASNSVFTNERESSGWIKATSFVFRGLRPRTRYHVQVRARDRNPTEEDRKTTVWVSLGSIETETFDHGSQVDLGNVVVGWHLMVPPNALDQDFVVQLSGNPHQFQTTSINTIQVATQKARAESGGYRTPIAGGIIEVVLMSVDGNPIQSPLSKLAELSYEFLDQAPKDGVVDQIIGVSNDRARIPELTIPGDENLEIRTKSLRLWYLDVETQSWFRVPNNDIDTFLSQVQGGIQRIGVFAVMGAPDFEVGDVVSFPVPFRPNGPNAGTSAGQTGTEASGITFANLPQTGTIQIFDMRGHLVKKLDLTGFGTAPWDVRNQDGQKVVSGTYIWMATSGGNTKTGKVVVIR